MSCGESANQALLSVGDDDQSDGGGISGETLSDQKLARFVEEEETRFLVECDVILRKMHASFYQQVLSKRPGYSNDRLQLFFHDSYQCLIKTKLLKNPKIGILCKKQWGGCEAYNFDEESWQQKGSRRRRRRKSQQDNEEKKLSRKSVFSVQEVDDIISRLVGDYLKEREENFASSTTSEMDLELLKLKFANILNSASSFQRFLPVLCSEFKSKLAEANAKQFACLKRWDMLDHRLLKQNAECYQAFVKKVLFNTQAQSVMKWPSWLSPQQYSILFLINCSASARSRYENSSLVPLWAGRTSLGKSSILDPLLQSCSKCISLTNKATSQLGIFHLSSEQNVLFFSDILLFSLLSNSYFFQSFLLSARANLGSNKIMGAVVSSKPSYCFIVTNDNAFCHFCPHENRTYPPRITSPEKGLDMSTEVGRRIWSATRDPFKKRVCEIFFCCRAELNSFEATIWSRSISCAVAQSGLFSLALEILGQMPVEVRKLPFFELLRQCFFSLVKLKNTFVSIMSERNEEKAKALNMEIDQKLSDMMSIFEVDEELIKESLEVVQD